MDADVVFFSWTGNTEKIARLIADELRKSGVKVNVQRIVPLKDHFYLFWLFLSFLPKIGVKIKPVKIESQNLFLCMPKWTFNCPPVTEFVRRSDLKGVRIFLVITFGGFDEKRYASAVKKQLEDKGARVVDTLLVKRKDIGNADSSIRDWVKDCVELMEQWLMKE